MVLTSSVEIKLSLILFLQKVWIIFTIVFVVITSVTGVIQHRN